jgi:hypothetical protein
LCTSLLTVVPIRAEHGEWTFYPCNNPGCGPFEMSETARERLPDHEGRKAELQAVVHAKRDSGLQPQIGYKAVAGTFYVDFRRV